MKYDTVDELLRVSLYSKTEIEKHLLKYMNVKGKGKESKVYNIKI